MIIKFTAPYPPSLNKMYQRGRNGPFLTDAARAYKTAVESAALTAGEDVGQPYFQDWDLLSITLHVYRPRKIGDIDNVAKLLLDAMQSITYSNDSQIVELHIIRRDDKLNPRIDVEVRDIGTDEKVLKRLTRKVRLID